jgi:hypothetical protein
MILEPGMLLQVKRRTPCLLSNGHNTVHLLTGDFVIFLNDCSIPVSGITIVNVIHPKAGSIACLLEDLRIPSKRKHKKTEK